MSATYFEFREAQNINELRALFELRHRVYRESRLASLADESEFGLDLSAFDLRAIHFGLFMVEGQHSKPVGYHRIVQEGIGPMYNEVLRLAQNFPGIATTISSVPAQPFPIMTYHPQPAIANLCSNMKAKGETLVEATKFSLDKATSTLALAKHVIESEGAIHLFYRNTGHIITTCTPLHARFYRQYGFEEIPETNFFIEQVEMRCLRVSGRSVPGGIRSKLMQMAEAYAKTRKVCFNPAEPNNFYAPKTQPEIREAAMSLAA